MKTNLRKIVLFTALALSILISACSKKQTIEIALIPTEKSMLDDGTFNKSALDGIKQYAEVKNNSYDTYSPESKSDEDYLDAMKKAIKNGAKIVITPGFNFETSVFTAQDLYPNVHFVLIDGVPNNGRFDDTREEKISSNTYSVLFAEEQAGFLAGYSIVKDGFRALGFLGGREFPAVVRYGYGFIQGAEYAAKELSLPSGEVTIKYDYAGNFEPTPENQSKASFWYNDGVEVIFACGGAMGNSVMQAAKMLDNKWVIGVDSDQSGDSETVITSAVKMIANSVNLAITSHYDDTFPGGQSISLGVDSDGVGLEMKNAKFRNFTQTDYDSIYNMLANDENGITSSIIKDLDIKPTDLPCEYVKLD